MTQEEIEALMNDTASEPSSEAADDNIDDILSGIDGIVDDEPASVPETNMDDILAGIDGIVDDEPTAAPEANMDDILAGIDGIVDDEPSPATDIDDMLAGIDGVVDDEPAAAPETNMDDILAGIDGIVDSAPEQPKAKAATPKEDTLETKIDKGLFPLPSSNEHKIVNQLNQVAEDSEEKASQIFDVLSFILDENEKVESALNKNSKFIESQVELLTKLTTKFPKIQLLQDQLNDANDLKNTCSDTKNVVAEENNKIFEAMELMQYHDINRQKIERVMSVIRKLTTYLNGIFEDDSNKPEVQIAKHISGDSNNTLDNDDLDSLINEFNK